MWLGGTLKMVEDSEKNRPAGALVDLYLDLLLTPPTQNEPVAGVALLPQNHNLTAAFVPGTRNTSSNTPVGWCMAVNRVGAFFCSSFKLDWKALLGNNWSSSPTSDDFLKKGKLFSTYGGTSKARRLILLHELAHIFEAPGVVSDAGSQALSDLNNSFVMHYCSDVMNQP